MSMLQCMMSCVSYAHARDQVWSNHYCLCGVIITFLVCSNNSAIKVGWQQPLGSHRSQSFTAFVERVQFFVFINGVTDNKHAAAAVLLSMIGEEYIIFFRNLLVPSSSKEKMLTYLIERKFCGLWY